MASTAEAGFVLPSARDITTTWWGQREEIGRAYIAMAEARTEAYVHTEEERRAWELLARETTQHAMAFTRFNGNPYGLFEVDEVEEAEPYISARAMVASMNETGVMKVSTLNADHPLWDLRQNTDFRIVHDGFGHYLSGGAFSWQGELDACGIHFRMVTHPLARRALFTECIGKVAAYYTNGKQHVGQVCGLMPEEFTKGILHG